MVMNHCVFAKSSPCLTRKWENMTFGIMPHTTHQLKEQMPYKVFQIWRYTMVMLPNAQLTKYGVLITSNGVTSKNYDHF